MKMRYKNANITFLKLLSRAFDAEKNRCVVGDEQNLKKMHSLRFPHSNFPRSSTEASQLDALKETRNTWRNPSEQQPPMSLD